MADKIKGENGIVYIWDSSAWKPLACLTSNSLNSTLSIIESTTKCNPGVVGKTPGQLNSSIDAEGEFIDTTSIGGDTAVASHDKLFSLQQDKTKVDFKYDPDVTNSGLSKYYGSCYFTDLSLAQGSGDEISTFSVTMEVDGAIVTTDPHD